MHMPPALERGDHAERVDQRVNVVRITVNNVVI
jgi:hypothetical protein